MPNTPWTQLSTIVMSMLMLTTACAMPLEAQTPHQETILHKNSLRNKAKKMQSVAQRHIKRIYKSLIGSKDCSKKEVLRTRLILIIATTIVIYYKGYQQIAERTKQHIERERIEQERQERALREIRAQEQSRRARELRDQKVRRAREQLHREQEEWRRDRERREYKERMERLRQEQEQREIERSRRIQKERREQMKRERQERLQRNAREEHAEDSDQTTSCCFTCHDASPTLQGIPCSNQHTTVKICRLCLNKIPITIEEGMGILHIIKPCPMCHEPLPMPRN